MSICGIFSEWRKYIFSFMLKARIFVSSPRGEGEIGGGSGDDCDGGNSGPWSTASGNSQSGQSCRRRANKEYFYNNLVKRKQQESTRTEYQSAIPAAATATAQEVSFFVAQFTASLLRCRCIV